MLFERNRPRLGSRHAPHARSRRRRFAVEVLEDRCVPSATAGHLARAALHPHGRAVQAPAALHAARQAVGAAVTSAPAPALSAQAVTAQAATPLQVWWTFPRAGQTTGPPGFFSVGFSQPLNPATANSGTVQLARQNASGGWDLVPATVAVNAGTNAVVITPITAAYDGANPISLQSNGVYVIAIYPGLQSTTGATLAAPSFTTFAINDPWGQPGQPDLNLLFPSSNGNSGVVIADQPEPLDWASVNPNTVRLYHVNADGSTGAQLPAADYHITYDPEIPSIEIAFTVALPEGNYRFVEQGVRNVEGNVLQYPVTRDFSVTVDQYFAHHWPPPYQTQIYVTGAYPPNSPDPIEVTPIASVTFNRPADPATVNSNTVGIARWDNATAQWVPVPADVTYNVDTQNATIVPKFGLAEGYYILAVSQNAKVVGTDGVPMAAPFYSFYNFNDPSVPIVNGQGFSPFPANGATVNGDPPAILVFPGKYAGDQPWSVNTNTVQLRPWLGNGVGNPLPISVSYNPWPGVIVITPLVPLGDGPYAVSVNGLVDIAGNVQRPAFGSWFLVTNSGRPQTLG